MPCLDGIEQWDKLQLHTTYERFCDDVWHLRDRTQGIKHAQIWSASLQTQQRTDSTLET